MQFRFINTPAIFWRRINYILREYLDNFIIVYQNNIIIYLNSVEEHKKHIKWVLRKLYKKTCQSQLRNVSSILGRLIL